MFSYRIDHFTLIMFTVGLVISIENIMVELASDRRAVFLPIYPIHVLRTINCCRRFERGTRLSR